MKNLSLLFLLVLFSADIKAESLSIVTNEFPPFQIVEGETVSGYTTEIVKHVVENAGLIGEIKAYPWARAYKMSLKEPNTLIYSIVRSPERESTFKWIGSIAPYDVYFWKLKKRKDIRIHNIEDAKKYMCGAMINGSKASILLKHGFIEGRNLELGDSDIDNLRKLYAGRIDLMLYDSTSFRYSALKEKKNLDDVEKLIKVEGISNELFLAASLGTPDRVVSKLRHSLEAFKKTNKYKEIKSHLR